MVDAVAARLTSVQRSIGTEATLGGLLLVGFSGLYLVLAPSTTPLTSLEIYNDKRLWQVAVLTATGLVLLGSRSTRRQWLSTFSALPLLARLGLGVVVGLGLLSVAAAPSWFYAATEVGHFVLLFVLAGVVATVVRQSSERAEAVLLGAVVLSALLYAVHFSVSYAMSVAWPALDVGRESISGFANTRHFNQYQTWTLPLLGATVLAVPARRRGVQGVVFFLTALWWTLILASNVRGTVVAMGFAAVGVGVLFRNRAVRWLGVQAAAFVAGAVLYYIAFYLVGETAPQVANRLAQEGGYVWRLERWTTCLEMAATHPWLGAGPMHFAWAPFRLASGAHPHNALMQWLAEWGVLSTALVSGLILWAGVRWLRQERNGNATSNTDTAVRVGLVASVVAATAHAMVSGLLVMPVSQVLLAWTGGWAWGRYRHAGAGAFPGRSAKRHLVFGFVIVAATAMVTSSLWDLSTIAERRTAYRETTDRSRFSPRYWQQGYVGTGERREVETDASPRVESKN